MLRNHACGLAPNYLPTYLPDHMVGNNSINQERSTIRPVLLKWEYGVVTVKTRALKLPYGTTDYAPTLADALETFLYLVVDLQDKGDLFDSLCKITKHYELPYMAFSEKDNLFKCYQFSYDTGEITDNYLLGMADSDKYPADTLKPNPKASFRIEYISPKIDFIQYYTKELVQKIEEAAKQSSLIN